MPHCSGSATYCFGNVLMNWLKLVYCNYTQKDQSLMFLPWKLNCRRHPDKNDRQFLLWLWEGKTSGRTSHDAVRNWISSVIASEKLGRKRSSGRSGSINATDSAFCRLSLRSSKNQTKTIWRNDRSEPLFFKILNK